MLSRRRARGPWGWHGEGKMGPPVGGDSVDSNEPEIRVSQKRAIRGSTPLAIAAPTILGRGVRPAHQNESRGPGGARQLTCIARAVEKSQQIFLHDHQRLLNLLYSVQLKR